MESKPSKSLAPRVAAALTTGLLTLPAAHAALIVQTVASGGTTTEWNDSIWGTPAAAPSSGNTYQSAAGLIGATSSSLGAANDLTGRVRAYAGGSGSPTFAGDSITIVSSTDLLVKSAGTYSAAINLDGGVLRYSPDSGGSTATMTGSITVASNSVLGSVQAGTNTFIVGSTITGSSTLRLAAGAASGDGTNQTITFDDGVGTSLNGFSGTLDIGGGTRRAIVDFNQAYSMGLAGMTMGNYSTVDILNLDSSISLAAFKFGVNPTLAAGTYTTIQLNGFYGSGSQFTGTGMLTVIPEPAAVLLGSFGLLGLLRRRRA